MHVSGSGQLGAESAQYGVQQWGASVSHSGLSVASAHNRPGSHALVNAHG